MKASAWEAGGRTSGLMFATVGAGGRRLMTRWTRKSLFPNAGILSVSTDRCALFAGVRYEFTANVYNSTPKTPDRKIHTSRKQQHRTFTIQFKNTGVFPLSVSQSV
jgi:hypothetical protein